MMAQVAFPGRILLWFFFIFCFIRPVFSQAPLFSEEIKFAQYLQNKELFREARFVVNKIDTSQLSAAQKDTVYYFSGWSAYNFKELDTAVSQLLRVSPQFSHIKKAVFLRPIV